MKIVFLAFDGMTLLDAIGPQEVLARLPGGEVVFAAPARAPVRPDGVGPALVPDLSIDEVTACDLLVCPGGLGTRRLMRDARVLEWVRAIDAGTRITASVCTGALVLGAAGLLAGRRANTHWAVRDRLASFGAIPTAARVVRDGKYASAAGVSAGIDLALTLAAELAGPEVAGAIQLGIEYDPDPPFAWGDPERAPAAVRDLVRARIEAAEAALALALAPESRVSG
jgi:putative intracellular protease/amidase